MQSKPDASFGNEPRISKKLVKAFIKSQWNGKGQQKWRKLRFFFLPSFVFGVLALILQATNDKKSRFFLGATSPIAVISLEDVIIKSDSFIALVEELKEEKTVKGVILKVDSPGGATVPSYEIYQALKRLKAEKKLFVWMGNLATSGGYMVSLAADRIYASPMSMTGSIGVILMSFSFEGLLQKLGVEPLVITAGKNKDILSPFHAPSKEQYTITGQALADYHQIFIAMVKENRKKLAPRPEIFDGRPFTAKEAKNLGMIDELSDFFGVLEQMKKQLQLPLNTEPFYPQEQENWDWGLGNFSFLQNWGGFLGFSKKQPSAGLMSIYSPGGF